MSLQKRQAELTSLVVIPFDAVTYHEIRSGDERYHKGEHLLRQVIKKAILSVPYMIQVFDEPAE